MFKTTDGGKTWQRSLFADPNTGCSGLSMDRHDPNTLVAGTWQVEMHTYAETSGGPGSAVYLTHDGGATWKKLENGLPKSPVGKIDVAIAPSDANRLYALIQTANQGSLWRSDDAGGTWKVVSWDRTLIGRAGYYIRDRSQPGQRRRSAHRQQQLPPLDRRRQDISSGRLRRLRRLPRHLDGSEESGSLGADRRQRHGHHDHSRAHLHQRVAADRPDVPRRLDRQVPYWIYSNRQDDGTMRGPSDRPVPVPNVPSYAGITGAGSGTGVPSPPRFRFGGDDGEGGDAWEAGLGGCESGFTLPADPDHPDIVWASCYGNQVTRYDARTKRARSVSPWHSHARLGAAGR